MVSERELFHEFLERILKDRSNIASPQAFGRFRNDSLLSLHLIDDHKAEIPDLINQFKNLEYLSLGDSKNRMDDFVTLPKTLAKLPKLRWLDIRYANFNKFPEIICELKHLTRLSLSHCNILYLPKSFGKLSNLQYLDLYTNYISALPRSFKNLDQLVSLELANNKIIEFPKCICKFKHLQHIGIHNNLITSIPNCIKNLKELKDVNVSENPIDDLERVQDFIATLLAEEI